MQLWRAYGVGPAVRNRGRSELSGGGMLHKACSELPTLSGARPSPACRWEGQGKGGWRSEGHRQASIPQGRDRRLES